MNFLSRPKSADYSLIALLINLLKKAKFVVLLSLKLW